MKVCLATFYTNDIKEYADLTSKINKEYCKNYNIDFVSSSERYYTNRTPHWERVPLILSILETNEYDWVIWIDADAFFIANNYKNIIDLIKNHDEHDFIFSRDIPHGIHFLNSGFFIVKNTDFAKKILKIWGFDEDMYNLSQSINRLNDQELLNIIYNKNELNIKNKSYIYDFGVLQTFNLNYKNNNDYAYVMHMAGCSKKLRIKIVNNYISGKPVVDNTIIKSVNTIRNRFNQLMYS